MRTRTRPLISRLLPVLALLLPLCALAGKDVYKDALLIEGPVKAKDSTVGAGNTAVSSKNWVFVIKVGDYTYAGYADRVGGIFARKGPQQEDWLLIQVSV